MTFLLDDFDPAKVQPRRGPDVRPSSLGAAVGASTSTFYRDINANFLRQREVIRERDTSASGAATRLGMDGIRPLLEERNRKAQASGMNSQMVDIPSDPAEAAALLGPNGSKAIMDLAREAAKADPEAWADMDLTEEGVEARVTARRVAEDADEAQILAMSNNPVMAQLIGSTAAALVDVRALPLMFMGGGGSILRIMGREALLGMGFVGLTLPSQFNTADELGKADPNVGEQLAFGAVAGAAIGGAVAGVARGVQYYRGRQTLPPGADPLFDEAAIRAAEDAIIGGGNPIAAAQEILRQKPLVLTNPLPREPLIPPEIAPNQPGPVVGGVEPVTVETLPSLPGQPRTMAEVVQQSDAAISQSFDDAISEAQAVDSPRAKPLISFLRDNHRVTKAQTKAAEKAGRPAPEAGESYQIDPNGMIAGELRANDVTPKTSPGLFKKGGRGDLDNLPASEMENRFPGIIEATGTRYGDEYLDRQGVINLIVRDSSGDASWLRSRADVQKLERLREEATNLPDGPVRDFTEGKRAPDGFYVDLNRYDFDGGGGVEQVARDFDDYLNRAWPGVLNDADKAEILTELQARGGDAEFMVERVLERKLDHGDKPANKADDYGSYDPEGYARFLDQSEAPRLPDEGRVDPSQPGQEPVAASGSPTGPGRDFGSEQTNAGQQSLIPGVAPITPRSRLEARQNAPLGGGATVPDSQIGGLFDPGAKARTDLFDNPGGPKSRPYQDVVAADLRRQIDTEDFLVDVGDGKGPRPASSILDDLDGDDEFLAILDACGKPKGGV